MKIARLLKINLLSICLILLVMLTSTYACGPALTSEVSISLGQAVSLSKSGNIGQAELNTDAGRMNMVASVKGTTIQLVDSYGKNQQIQNGTQLVTNTDSLNAAELVQVGFVAPENFNVNSSSGNALLNILYIALPVISIIVLIFLMSGAGRRVTNDATNFSRSKARLITRELANVTFADVAGVEEAKEDLEEVVQFLKSPARFQKIGAKIPKGVLLVGPPGTGKTLMARAVAGEAGVPFFSVSGSEFVEMFVGVGAARVRDLFEQAKRSSPCIVFIDELDAVGGKRVGSGPGGQGEREQTLNQILTEMDGFDANAGVIVLAATNRPDTLDAALLRPGRFDRRVALDLPDTNARLAIIRIHAKNKIFDPAVDMANVAKETHGFSGADLANLLNEAAILTVRRNKDTIGVVEVEDSIDRVIAGPERKSMKINPKDKEMTAYHEAGHALVAHLLPNADPVQKISIVARGSMGGYTRLSQSDKYFVTAAQFRDILATSLAGHASEELLFNEISTGPHSDIKQATALARQMVMDYGMSEKLGLRTYNHEAYGPAYYTPEDRDYSDNTAREIDEEVSRILQEEYQVALKTLRENRARLVHIAERLLVVETLTGDELERAFAEPLDDKIAVSDNAVKKDAVVQPPRDGIQAPANKN